MACTRVAILIIRVRTLTKGSHCPQNIGEVDSVAMGEEEEGGGERAENTSDNRVWNVTLTNRHYNYQLASCINTEFESK